MVAIRQQAILLACLMKTPKEALTQPFLFYLECCLFHLGCKSTKK